MATDYSKYAYSGSVFPGLDKFFGTQPSFHSDPKVDPIPTVPLGDSGAKLYPGSIPGETLPEYYSRMAVGNLDVDLADLIGLGDKSSAKPKPTPTYYAPPKIDYLNADLAKAYGMDATTAYQEALSNTSYQRAVKDLQAAGLNPVLAATGLDGASGVYGAQKNGSGVTVYGNTSSAHDAYKIWSAIGTVIGGVAGAAATKSPAGAVAGATAGGKIAGSIGNLFD